MSEDEINRVYDRIIEKIGTPVRVSKTKGVMEFLKELYPPEEVKVIDHLAVFMPRKTPEEVAKEGNLDLSYVRSVLERGAKKGKVAFFKKEGTYALLPFMPGIFEMTLVVRSKKGKEDEIRREARSLGKEFHHWGHEVGASGSPWARVIPIESSIDTRSEVLPFERVSTLIEEARRIFVTDCVCRVLFKNCDDKPIEACFYFDLGLDAVDIGIDFLKDEGVYRELDKDEARQILINAEESGLVHMTMNSQKGRVFICNCCSCCCGILRGLVELHNPNAFVKSNFMPAFDREKCKKCETCVKICPTGALYYHIGHKSDGTDDEIKILAERCIGCGLCASHCPKEAVTLTKARENIPPKEVWDTYIEYEKKRIH